VSRQDVSWLVSEEDAGPAAGQSAISRRDLLRAALAGVVAWALGELGAADHAVARAQVLAAPRPGQAEQAGWSAYAGWLKATWTTMAYPQRYDCDLPLWYMAMWAKEKGLRLDWSWPNYFRQPVVLRFTGVASRDLPLQSWRFSTYEEFGRLSQAYFGIKHLPVLVGRTGGRQLPDSALQMALGQSRDQFWPGDIISSGDHAMVFIEPYGSSSHYLLDYRRPRVLQRRLRLIEESAARLAPDEQAEYEAAVSLLRQRIVRHVRDLQAAEQWMGYHTPGNPWDAAIEEALARGEVPGFVPGRIVDSPGVDSPKGDWSQFFSGIVYPDLSDQPLPHITSGSGRTVWEWFRPLAGGEECDWRCSTIVLRPFDQAGGG